MDFSNLEIMSWHYAKGFVKLNLVIYFRVTFLIFNKYGTKQLKQSIQGKALRLYCPDAFISLFIFIFSKDLLC